MTHQFWFKPKIYGYGATPVTWEGWALVAAYVVVMAASVMLALRERSFLVCLLAAAVIAAATAAMTVLSMKKTDGRWHWSWGGAENSGKND